MTQAGIVFVTAFLGQPHGTAKSARDFLRALLASSAKVTVVSPHREEMPEELCGRTLSRPVWLKSPTGTRLPILRSWWVDQKRRRFLHSLEAANLIIVNGWASIEYWRRFADEVKATTALIVRESPRHFTDEGYDVGLKEVLRTMAEFDVLIFVSDSCRREWLEFPELRGRQSYFVPNCCEEEETQALLKQERAAVRQRLGLGADEFIVVCPGTIERRKGQDLLLDVLPELNAGVKNLRVLLIGDPRTEWGTELARKMLQSPMMPRITHWPSRPGILDALYAADALAFPSRAEAMPRTILEAMALKTPLVACAVDGVVELVENHRTGILFEREDKAGLLKGLLALGNDPQLAKNMAEAGYAKYWQDFSRNHQFDCVQEAVDSICKNGSAAANDPAISVNAGVTG